MTTNYEHYKMFCEVAECENISKAAEKLFVSQPAVSLAIKQLERDLKIKLFLRNQRGVELTYEGKVLYGFVKNAFNLIELGENKLKEMQDLQGGEINIGASDMTLRFYLMPLIEQFHKVFPKIKIKIKNAPTPETLIKLKNSEIDFGVVSGPIEKFKKIYKKDFAFEAIKDIRDILIAGNIFKENIDEFLKDNNKNKLNADDLRNYEFVMLQHGTNTRDYIDNYLKDNLSYDLNEDDIFYNEEEKIIIPEIELATSDLVVDFIKRNMGIGFIMEDFAKNALEAGEVFKIDLEPELEPRKFYIVKSSSLLFSNAAKKLLECGVKM